MQGVCRFLLTDDAAGSAGRLARTGAALCLAFPELRYSMPRTERSTCLTRLSYSSMTPGQTVIFDALRSIDHLSTAHPPLGAGCRRDGSRSRRSNTRRGSCARKRPARIDRLDSSSVLFFSFFVFGTLARKLQHLILLRRFRSSLRSGSV